MADVLSLKETIMVPFSKEGPPLHPTERGAFLGDWWATGWTLKPSIPCITVAGAGRGENEPIFNLTFSPDSTRPVTSNTFRPRCSD